jgi:hypothetical protein
MSHSTEPSPHWERPTKAKNRFGLSRKNPFSGKNASQRSRLVAAFSSMESKFNRPKRTTLINIFGEPIAR